MLKSLWYPPSPGLMEVKCPDGIGRESWDWGVPHALASPGSPPSGGKKPSLKSVPAASKNRLSASRSDWMGSST